MLNVISGLLAGGVAASTTSYESIATATLTGNQTTVTFSSIPSTYKHLQLRVLARTDRASNTQANMLIQFNSDTASNYYPYHGIEGDGSTAAAYANGGTGTSINVQRLSGATATAGVFGAIVVDLLDYQNTNKYKTVRSLGGVDNNGSGLMTLYSGLWMSTSAVNRIDLTAVNGSVNFTNYSSFALYGIKG